MADSSGLTPEQSDSLFDILTHRQTYSEIEAFKQPDTINHYGPPFQDAATKSQTPILQTLLSKFILKLPGFRDVSTDFWKVQVEELIHDLSEAELSESYDKGVLGIRKTLATAVSALIEYPARECLGGVPDRRLHIKKGRNYDTSNPDDVLQAWQDCLQDLIYGGLVDRLFDKAAETDNLEEHESLVKGMHEFVLVNIASLMHYTLILSPEGPTLLRMIENVHRLLPYTLVRQSLKIGNVATMISSVMRVCLAKVSMGSVANWMGLSAGADEGMNLMQQIISQVLGWEKRELKSRAAKIEKDKDAPPKEVLSELKEWMGRDRSEHEECRRQSKSQNLSIVTVVLSLSSIDCELSEPQHSKALEYLSLNLGIRDRQEIVRVLCNRNPDHLTAAIRDGVDAYTPMIRHVHQAVNLSDTVWDFERFVTDMLKMSKLRGDAKERDQKPASVEDFVDLLHRHQTSSHKFLHQVAKNDKEITSWWRDYVHMAASQFKFNVQPPDSGSAVPKKVAAGGIRQQLEKAFSDLSPEDQEKVKAELDAYTNYLSELHSASFTRISAIIRRTQSSPYGPGAYLARWQHLMNTTAVTPATPKGPVRYGGSKSVKEAGRKDIYGQEAGLVSEEEAEKAIDERTPDAPSAETTLTLFGEKFREALTDGE